MSDFFPVVIHHNPKCGSSRNALAMIEAAGYRPVVVDYVSTGWTRPQLLALAAAMGQPLKALLRDKGTPAAELGLLEPGVTDETLLAAMVEHPILVNRPIVATPKGVKLCRPAEVVLTLLDRQPAASTHGGGQAASQDPAR